MLAIGTITGRLAYMPSKVSLLAVGGVGVRQVKSVTVAQPKKAFEPMVSMLRSMQISSREVHPSKAFAGMLFNEVGKVTLVNDVQLRKQPSPNFEMEACKL